MTKQREPLSALAGRTVDTYERQATRYDAERGKSLFERPWLDRFSSLLPPGGSVLDAGCGTGDPIAHDLARRGLRVTGVDAAQAMIALARQKHPGGDWRQADMRTLDLGTVFDGVIAWDSFFHLTGDEQRATLPRLAGHLKPRGALMLTVGPEAGEVVGAVGGAPVFHASLSPDDYRAVLTGLGLAVIDFVPEDPDCNGHSVLLAQRT
ncbi:class I SAM-dependent methyltransferase [Hoeflea olei]|uniref:Methyltransferase n=1 Tax=Hoeflea olei TaxID=1480615 RepID=A0A1C1Z1M7_9HYPH|nr:class I SAM-dependent methyltransferase [Hoeflea olei]OCW59630.1 methyltransferase [Hoeflea olei]